MGRQGQSSEGSCVSRSASGIRWRRSCPATSMTAQPSVVVVSFSDRSRFEEDALLVDRRP